MKISGGLKTGLFLLGIVFFISGLSAVAESEFEQDRKLLKKLMVEDQTDRAVQRGLAWLVARQDKKNGNFGENLPHAYTALSCMALMAAGEQPGRSKYGHALQLGLLYLAEKAIKNGGYLGNDGSRMYGHGIATLVLCEGYGMLDSPEANRKVGQAIKKALAVTLKAQVKEAGSIHRGGWRYEPTTKDADLSVTAWQILTLRAAKNCGFDVPESAVENSLDYVRRLHSGAGFSYQQGRAPTPAMQAAGIVCLKMLGADTTEADKAKIAISAKSIEGVDSFQGHHYYYQCYYLATAANMLGDKSRTTFLPKLEKSLLRLQQKDGQFAKHSGHDGGIYATAFAVICLSVHYQYLPIYQE